MTTLARIDRIVRYPIVEEGLTPLVFCLDRERTPTVVLELELVVVDSVMMLALPRSTARSASGVRRGSRVQVSLDDVWWVSAFPGAKQGRRFG